MTNRVETFMDKAGLIAAALASIMMWALVFGLAYILC